MTWNHLLNRGRALTTPSSTLSPRHQNTDKLFYERLLSPMNIPAAPGRRRRSFSSCVDRNGRNVRLVDQSTLWHIDPTCTWQSRPVPCFYCRLHVHFSMKPRSGKRVERSWQTRCTYRPPGRSECPVNPQITVPILSACACRRYMLIV